MVHRCSGGLSGYVEVTAFVRSVLRRQVDHCVKYRQKGEKNAEGEYVEPEEPTYNAMPPTLEGASRLSAQYT